MTNEPMPAGLESLYAQLQKALEGMRKLDAAVATLPSDIKTPDWPLPWLDEMEGEE